MVDDDPVLLEVKGAVAVISLNRPDQHNMVGDAADALFFRYLDLLRNDRDVRAVIWRGNGPSFSSGRDLAEVHDHPGAGASRRSTSRPSDGCGAGAGRTAKVPPARAPNST